MRLVRDVDGPTFGDRRVADGNEDAPKLSGNLKTEREINRKSTEI